MSDSMRVAPLVGAKAPSWGGESRDDEQGEDCFEVERVKE
jgi:hypothetical protein